MCKISMWITTKYWSLSEFLLTFFPEYGLNILILCMCQDVNYTVLLGKGFEEQMFYKLLFFCSLFSDWIISISLYHQI